jgi:hypothetical protein
MEIIQVTANSIVENALRMSGDIVPYTKEILESSIKESIEHRLKEIQKEEEKKEGST